MQYSQVEVAVRFDETPYQLTLLQEVIVTQPDYTAKTLSQTLEDLTSQLRGRLHPDVQFDIFRHGNAAPQASTADGTDFQRQLTEKGWAQVRELGQKITHIPYDHIITSPAPRAIHTALVAVIESRGTVQVKFRIGTGMQFYGPTTPGHFAELFRIGAELGGANNYGGYVAADTLGIFQAFQVELLEALLEVPGIESAQSIFVSNHGVIGSCLAEALLHVLAGKIDELSRKVLYDTSAAECSCFQVSKAGVQYIDYLAA